VAALGDKLAPNEVEGEDMIKITIELWPMGDVSRRSVLHEAAIWNTGGTDTRGEYRFAVSKVGGFKLRDEALPEALGRSGMFGAEGLPHVLRAGEVSDFPRKRLYAVDLLYRCLRGAFGERNP
jgi:hypothetical protein